MEEKKGADLKVFFLVLILVFIFGKTIYDECTKNRKAFTAEELGELRRLLENLDLPTEDLPD